MSDMGAFPFCASWLLTLFSLSFSSSKPELSQLSRCLAIVTYILRQAVPSPTSSKSTRSHLPNGCRLICRCRPDWTSASPTDRITLIKTALTAYMEIVDVFPLGQREEYYAVAIYLYSELLKDESSKVDLSGPTLSVLKALCDRAYAVRQPTSHGFPRVLHGLLSACILHIDEMRFVSGFLSSPSSLCTELFLFVGGVRGRTGPVALSKVKNNLLALVLILTGLPEDIRVGRSVVERTCEIIGQKLSADEDEVSVLCCPLVFFLLLD